MRTLIIIALLLGACAGPEPVRDVPYDYDTDDYASTEGLIMIVKVFDKGELVHDYVNVDERFLLAHIIGPRAELTGKVALGELTINVLKENWHWPKRG